ncbi:WxL domain-containing protein [Vagococcus sp. BWB3-3]|uniref:WxL domain-containing protein n=1 Tax=Vagococcus allomyrinae TaxID=2794353 RepID=A0A940P5E6_9ENTE|nr:WxL domain-containing protein [Vagococcus allomyrinae]MBP1040081.1 WxL domain-containing protein [Vagococcus allomyrinae]
MKNKLSTLLTLTICASILGAATPAFAGEVGSETTTGKVEFTTDDDETGTIVKPDEEGEDDEVITIPEEEGTTGSGPLRIQFVPAFSFVAPAGISTELKTYDAKLTKYNADGKMPAFVQVTNNSGENPTWNLKAKASVFKNGDHELTGASINFNGSTLTTTGFNTANANTKLNKQSATTLVAGDEDSTVSVLSAKAGADTNGQQLSNVFQDDYKIADDYDGQTTTTGVQLIKPAGIAPKKGTYTSTITWTLEDGI